MHGSRRWGVETYSKRQSSREKERKIQDFLEVGVIIYVLVLEYDSTCSFICTEHRQ